MVEGVAVNREALVEDRKAFIQLRLERSNGDSVLAKQILEFV